jgi:hypothetical protein
VKARLRIQSPEGDRVVYEEVLVEALADGARVLNSPALIENLAAGDVIRFRPDGTFEHLRRSGNLCVQVFRGRPPSAEVEDRLNADVEALRGWLDVSGNGFLVYTVPIRPAGFAAVERAFNRAVEAEPSMSWMYGNVYDPRTGDPLNWWEA